MKLILVVIVSLALSFYAVWSQDTIKTYYLGEIEVTAYRGGGEVLNLPMAVSSVDFNDFKLKRNVGLSDVLNTIPGVIAQSRAGSYDVKLVIRGFGSRGYGDKSNAGTIRGIKVLIDGFPETEPDGRTSLDFVDLSLVERIEVIRTNASTLFGNTSGGIVNFETIRVRNTFAEADGIYGDFGLLRMGLKSGVTFESGDMSLMYSSLDFRGWRENSAVKRRQIYSILRIKIGSATQFKMLTGFVSNYFQIPGPLTMDEFNLKPSKANDIYLLRKERRYNRIGKIGLNLTTAMGKEHGFDFRLYLVPKILQRSERSTFRDFNRYFVGVGFVYQYNREDGNLKPKFALGYDDSYQDGTILFYNLKDGERGDSLRTNKREAGRTNGVFLRFEFQPFRKISLALGLRYDIQNYVSEIYPAGVKRFVQKDLLKMHHWTPSFSALYRVNENNSVYFTISGGVEAPAFNEVDPPPELKNVSLNPLLKPMSSQTFEFGFKGVAILNNLIVSDLIYSVSLFKIRVQNELVSYANGKWFFSAGKSIRNGIELGGMIKFKKLANLKFTLTHIDAKYVKYENDIGDLSGKTVPGIPKLWGSTGLEVDLRSFILNSELIYVGKYYADDSNEIEVSGYAILNASFGVKFTISKLKFFFAAGVSNLTNRKYISSIFVNPERAQPYAYIEPGLPRNFFVRVSVGLDAF